MNNPQLSTWLDESDKQLVLIIFTADWAGSVAILEDFMAKIEEEMPTVRVNWVDIEANEELANPFPINQLPSIIMLRSHEVVDHVNGLLPRRKLAARIALHV